MIANENEHTAEDVHGLAAHARIDGGIDAEPLLAAYDERIADEQQRDPAEMLVVEAMKEPQKEHQHDGAAQDQFRQERQGVAVEAVLQLFEEGSCHPNLSIIGRRHWRLNSGRVLRSFE